MFKQMVSPFLFLVLATVILITVTDFTSTTSVPFKVTLEETKLIQTNSIHHRRGSYERISRRRIPRRVKTTRVQHKTKWKMFQDAVYWITLRNTQDKGWPVFFKHEFESVI